MKWVRDTTGRLAERPHYDPAELDAECESLVATFLRARHGAVAYPLSTDDLTVLLERESDDLDLYADLAVEGPGVEGVTEFVPGRKPRVRIATALSDDEARQHRLRTTLAHELGHVRLHAFLWSFPAGKAATVWAPGTAGTAGTPGTAGTAGTPGRQRTTSVSGALGAPGLRCQRDSMLRAPARDWLEWQAGYASGAILMPATAFDVLANAVLCELGKSAPVFFRGPASRELTRRVQRAFDVSADAAAVRLLQRGFLTRQAPSLAPSVTLDTSSRRLTPQPERLPGRPLKEDDAEGSSRQPKAGAERLPGGNLEHRPTARAGRRRVVTGAESGR